MLLADPGALRRFAEHEVVLPVVVITELEGKRHHPELGLLRPCGAAAARRAAGRARAARRAGAGRRRRRHDPGRAQPHRPARRCPSGFRLGDNDTRILAVARNLADEGHDVTLVSKDLPMRIKASAVGLDAEEYRAEHHRRLRLDRDGRARGRRRPTSTSCTTTGRVDLEAARELPCHTGLVLLSDRGSGAGPGRRRQAASTWSAATATRSASTAAPPSSGSPWRCCSTPRSASSRLGGRAGTGKSAMALCAGLEAVMERRQHKKVVVFRPLFAVGGQELGYLPGTESEKMSPWGQAVFDTLGAITSREVIEEVLDRGMLEVLPLTHIRGRSLHDAFVIVDEAQSLERNVLLTVLSRIGPTPRWCSPTTSPSATTSGSAGTTASSRWSRSSRATRCSPTSR